METQSPLLRLTVRLILATLIVFIMVVGKSFLIPFAWSLLIALSSLRIIKWVKSGRKANSGVRGVNHLSVTSERCKTTVVFLTA